MPVPRRSYAIVVAFSLACSDAVTAPGGRSVALEADDSLRVGLANQIVSTLEVRATANGEPAAGVPVSWSAEAGTLVHADARTDASGFARATWRLEAVAHDQVVTAAAGDTMITFHGRVPVGAVQVTPAAATVWVGDSLQVSAVVHDSAGTPLAWSAAWTSSDPAIVDVVPVGRVSARDTGRATIRAVGLDARASIRVVPIGTTSTIAGQVHALEPQRALPALRIHYRDANGAASAEAQPDGSFVLTLRYLPEPTDTGLLTIEPVGDERMQWHPAIRVVSDDRLAPIDVLLLPTSWTIRAGLHAGTVRTISPNAALVNGPDISSFLGGRWEQASGIYHVARTQWPDSAFPIDVHLAPRPGEPAFSAAESTAVWQQIDRLETIIGRDLLEPAQLPADAPYPPFIPGSIYISRSPDAGGVAGAQPAEWRRTVLNVPLQPGPATLSIATGELITGGLLVPFSGGGVRLVQHEMGHALGLGHGCAWVSVMTTCAAGPYYATTEMTATDVAYWEISRAVAARDRELGLHFSLASALMGERVHRLDLPILPGH